MRESTSALYEKKVQIQMSLTGKFMFSHCYFPEKILWLYLGTYYSHSYLSDSMTFVHSNHVAKHVEIMSFHAACMPFLS